MSKKFEICATVAVEKPSGIVESNQRIASLMERY
jgi:hypothetical protein